MTEAKILIEKAKALHNDGDNQSAEQTYFEAVKNCDDAWTWIELANFYDATKQYDKVLKVTNGKIRRDFLDSIDSVAEIHNHAILKLGPEKTQDIPEINVANEGFNMNGSENEEKSPHGYGPSKAEHSSCNNNFLAARTSENLSNADIAWHALNTYGWDCSEVVAREEKTADGYYFVTCSSGKKLRVYPRPNQHPKITNENGGYN